MSCLYTAVGSRETCPKTLRWISATPSGDGRVVPCTTNVSVARSRFARVRVRPRRVVKVADICRQRCYNDIDHADGGPSSVNEGEDRAYVLFHAVAPLNMYTLFVTAAVFHEVISALKALAK